MYSHTKTHVVNNLLFVPKPRCYNVEVMITSAEESSLDALAAFPLATRVMLEILTNAAFTLLASMPLSLCSDRGVRSQEPNALSFISWIIGTKSSTGVLRVCRASKDVEENQTTKRKNIIKKAACLA